MNIFGCIANLFISNDTRQTQSGSEIRGTAPWNLPFHTATPCVYPQVRFWPFERYVFKSKIWAPFTVPFTPSLPSCFYPQVMCPLCHCNSSSAEEPSGLKCILRNRFVFSYFQFVFWLKQTNLPRSLCFNNPQKRFLSALIQASEMPAVWEPPSDWLSICPLGKHVPLPPLLGKLYTTHENALLDKLGMQWAKSLNINPRTITSC